MTRKAPSNQAQVAKLIRKHLKTVGIKGKVTSEGYSMGDNVNVTIYDQPPNIVAQIKEHCTKYEKGHFDGMTDMYEYSNSRNDIPQTKYLFISNIFSEELKQEAWNFIHSTFTGAEEYPKSLKDVPPSARVFEQWVSDLIFRLLNGSMIGSSEEFWAMRKSND